MYKIGIGYDAHRLEKGEKLILGGVDIKNEYGIIGHSDGDVLDIRIREDYYGLSAGQFLLNDSEYAYLRTGTGRV